MRRYKKLQIILLLLLLVTAYTPAYAEVAPPAPGSVDEFTKQAAQAAGYDQNTSATTVGTVVGTLVRTFLSLLGIIFIVYTIYGGFLWMTSAGNDEKVTQAKKIIQNGVIGLIVILSTAAIYFFVRTAVGLNTNTTPAGGVTIETE